MGTGAVYVDYRKAVVVQDQLSGPWVLLAYHHYLNHHGQFADTTYSYSVDSAFQVLQVTDDSVVLHVKTADSLVRVSSPLLLTYDADTGETTIQLAFGTDPYLLNRAIHGLSNGFFNVCIVDSVSVFMASQLAYSRRVINFLETPF
jgi:hypothetical protein